MGLWWILTIFKHIVGQINLQYLLCANSNIDFLNFLRWNEIFSICFSVGLKTLLLGLCFENFYWKYGVIRSNQPPFSCIVKENFTYSKVKHVAHRQFSRHSISRLTHLALFTRHRIRICMKSLLYPADFTSTIIELQTP